VKPDTWARLLTHLFAFVVIGAAFYGLVLYPFELDPLVKGALIGWGGAAIAFEFGQEIAKATSAATQRAYDKGLATPTPTITVQGDPPSAAVTPQTPTTDMGG
jgi:hypothetical protein